MAYSKIEIRPGIWLDSRRAVYIEKEQALGVADLHLGYAWAHRYNGQLLPIHADGWAEELEDLFRSYGPKKLLFLGDVVHRAVPVAELERDLAVIAERFGGCEIELLLGNHDRDLNRLKLPNRLKVNRLFRCEGILCLHGDVDPGEREELMVIGHEHPAIKLGDGVATSAKFPCFLIARDLLVLPAFSRWVAGTNHGSYPFMSVLAKKAKFEQAIAIMGTRLLPVPMPEG